MTGKVVSGARKALRALVTRRIEVVCDLIPYELENLSYRKILNWIRTEASVLFKPERPWGFPTHLQLEPTTACNLACTLCPVTAGLGRARQHMPLETFRRTIDELGDYLLLVLLWDWGEPFLNPSVYEMIAYARQRGIRVASSTNGHLFAQAEHADRLVRSGLDTVIFAVDGITQESYARYRQGGSLETVLEGIRNVVARKRQLGSPTPLVNLRFIVMKHNEHEVPGLRDAAKELGVDVLTLKTLNPCAQDPYEAEKEAPLHEDMLPDDARFRRFVYTEEGARVRVARNPCRNLWNCTTIHAGGKVCPCTYDPKEAYVLGDVTAATFREIWLGEEYRALRRRFRENWKGIELCRECSYAYEGGSCVDETIAEAQFLGPRPFSRGS